MGIESVEHDALPILHRRAAPFGFHLDVHIALGSDYNATIGKVLIALEGLCNYRVARSSHLEQDRVNLICLSVFSHAVLNERNVFDFTVDFHFVYC